MRIITIPFVVVVVVAHVIRETFACLGSHLVVLSAKHQQL